MKQSHCQDYSEGHVCESVEEQFEERSSNFSSWKDDPVSEVSDVVFLVFALECQEGEIGGNEVADKTGHDGIGFEDGTEYKQDHKDDEEEDTGFDVVLFLNELEWLHSIECLKFEWLNELIYLVHEILLYKNKAAWFITVFRFSFLKISSQEIPSYFMIFLMIWQMIGEMDQGSR